jgi:hypothetical protein
MPGGIPREVAVHLTAKPTRFDALVKRINGLQDEPARRTGEWPAPHHGGHHASARDLFRHGAQVLAELAV